MPLTKAQRLTRCGFKKKSPTVDDYLDHLKLDVSKIIFNHENEDDKPKVSVHCRNEDIGAGGETIHDALEWLIISKYEKDNPIDE